MFEAVRLVLTQFLLKDMKLGVVEGQYVLSPASAGKPIAITPNLILNLTLTLIYHTNLVTHTIPLLFLQTFLHKQGCLFFMSLFVEMPTPPYLPYPTLNPILTLPYSTLPYPHGRL